MSPLCLIWAVKGFACFIYVRNWKCLFNVSNVYAAPGAIAWNRFIFIWAVICWSISHFLIDCWCLKWHQFFIEALIFFRLSRLFLSSCCFMLSFVRKVSSKLRKISKKNFPSLDKLFNASTNHNWHESSADWNWRRNWTNGNETETETENTNGQSNGNRVGNKDKNQDAAKSRWHNKVVASLSPGRKIAQSQSADKMHCSPRFVVMDGDWAASTPAKKKTNSQCQSCMVYIFLYSYSMRAHFNVIHNSEPVDGSIVMIYVISRWCALSLYLNNTSWKSAVHHTQWAVLLTSISDWSKAKAWKFSWNWTKGFDFDGVLLIAVFGITLIKGQVKKKDAKK